MSTQHESASEGRGLVNAVLSAWVWLVLAVWLLVLCPLIALVWCVTRPFDPGVYRAGRMFRCAGPIVNWANPIWRCRVSGRRITDPRRFYQGALTEEGGAARLETFTESAMRRVLGAASALGGRRRRE